MTAKNISSQIKLTARSLGFDQVGITSLAKALKGEAHLKKWTQANRHGDMKYLEDFERRRVDFFKDFSDAKSVIVLGVNYFSHEVATSARPPRNDDADVVARGATNPSHYGRIARYAWGKDYHEIIAQKHHALIEELERISPSVKAVSCVDTKPIPERFSATQSGLGFVGKNTMLLSDQFGPWLFLSEIVTNLDLEEDLEAKGTCGTCVKCKDVCPTGALDEDYNMDARLCIAYLTIEYKGVIPRELRPKIKDWVFGCDECLSICPFTSKEKETQWKELKAESGKGEWMVFDELFELSSNRLYEDYFKGTALLRAGRKQMMRNACVVLGNSKSENAIPYLHQALQDQAPLVRLHAAWALGELDFPEAGKFLEKHLEGEKDDDVRAEVMDSLETFRQKMGKNKS